MEFGFVGQSGIFGNGSDFGRRWVDSISVNNMPEEVNLLSSNGALLGFEVQAMCSEAVEDFVEEVHMLFEGCRVDHDIINVDIQSFPNEIMENFIHDMLESGRGIARSEGHSGEFVLAIRGDKR